ncbi:vacuolar protein sorting-associated protein 11 [Ascodesmis nigricans]|uniref:E3 ubiquitin-protein ligase PEP5 n=1 Tax=Ascodesmis nigricans TaxID=341454 RepID=A0A4S2N8I6_9PEZI|nr:vacuolar protein sorting-associated protein 11 [Ascodesmis nigricans]
MALATWKSFNFFTATPVKPADDPENAPPPFEGADITSVTTGSDNLFIGTASGHVHVVNSSFKTVRTFAVAEDDYDQHSGAVTHMKQIEGTSLLVTIVEDLSSEPTLKVWALDKVEKKTGGPRCQCAIVVNNKKRKFPTSAFAATASLKLCAVGFANGSITLIRGDLIHDLGSKQKIVFESDEPITNLCFSPPPVESSLSSHKHHHHQTSEGGDTLYASTTARILTLSTGGKSSHPPRVLETQGCSVGCLTPAYDLTSDERGLLQEGGDIVVARDDAIYFYGPNGRGACYNYEGPKQFVRIFKNYVALVSPPSSRPSTAVHGAAVSGAFKRLVGKGPELTSDPLWDATKFNLLDTELKFIAHTERLVSGVKELFISWGDLFVLTLDGKLHRYHEVSLQEKLDTLYQRNLFILAINLAQKAGVPENKLRGIYRRYADYLYSKSDYDNSMQWYIKSLGQSNEQGVSNVIRKFLDNQRIHNLIEYLEELHKHGIATSDHTTLLLNCYAKLKDEEKLEAFIKQADEGLKFDVDTAIAMCRQAGYFEQAVYLAQKQEQHGTVASILVENLRKIDDALLYIRTLDPDSAYSILMRYARVFFRHEPTKTKDLFVEYYTGSFVPRPKSPPGTATSPDESTASQGFQAYLPLNANLLQQLPYVGGGSTSATNTPVAQKASASQPQITKVEETTIPLDVPRKYRIPKPRTAFSSFVDHPEEFVDFLEKILEAGENSGTLSTKDKTDIYTTLFEMYLQRANASESEQLKQEYQAKASKIIEARESVVDTSDVLLLSHLANFSTGTTLVREKQGLRFDIFRSLISAGDTAGVIKALHRYGPEEPQLYPAALSYFTSSPDILRAVGEDELERVLKVIDEQGLMKPLQVVQTLSTNAVATVGMVKKYLGDTIEKERREIENNAKMIETYRLETAQKTAEIADLGSKPAVFQSERCNACGMRLDLPTVHFLCKHSFHQRCLDPPLDGEENQLECATCASQNHMIRTLRRGQDEAADRHEYFKEMLRNAKPGERWGVVAEFFGKGVMTSVVPGFE